MAGIGFCFTTGVDGGAGGRGGGPLSPLAGGGGGGRVDPLSNGWRYMFCRTFGQ